MRKPLGDAGMENYMSDGYLRKNRTRIVYWGFVTTILFFGIFLRFRDLDSVKSYYYDEVYHVPAAKMIAKGDARAYQWWHGELKDEIQPGTAIDWLHPPLAKLIQAVSIRFWGDNQWGWRFSSALMGVILLAAVFFLTRMVCPDHPWAAVIALALATVDGLAVAQSQICMNDIFVTFFMALGVLLYLSFLRKRSRCLLLLLALVCGCAIASKWSGVFLLVFIAVWELFVVRRYRPKPAFRRRFLVLIFLGMVSVSVYLIAYSQLFAQHGFNHFIQLHRQIFNYQVGLNATHPYSSKAWEWPLGLKPVYMYVDDETGMQVWNRPFYPAWYFGFIGLVSAMVILFIPRKLMLPTETKRKKTQTSSFSDRRYHDLFFLVVAYFCFWIFWVASPRLLFFHHYLPAATMLWVITALAFTILCERFRRRFRA